MAGKTPKPRRGAKGAHSKSMQRGTKRAAARAQADRARRTEGAQHRRLEAALREAHAVVESALEGISKLDDRGHYVLVNAQYAALLGCRPEELIGQSWEITVHPEDRMVVMDTFTRMLAVGRAEAEIRGVKKDGSLFHKHVVIVKPDGPAIKTSGHFCFVRDVTERKREEALQAAEKQALELVAKGTALNDVLAFICRTIEGHTAPMLCSVMRVTEDGAHLSSVAGPSLPDEYNRLVHGIPIGPTVGSCGSAAYFRRPAIVADIATDPLWKDYAPVALSYGLKACWSQPIVSAAGDLLGTFAAYYREPRVPQPNDLKIVERAGHIAALAIEHAAMTDALRESESRFRAIADTGPALIWIAGLDKRCTHFNRRWLDYTGRTLEQELGDGWAEGVHPDDIEHCLQIYSEAFARRDPFEMDYRLRKADGQYGWIHDSGVPRFLPGGTFAGYLGACIDITAQKQRETDLKLFRVLLDQVTDSIEVIDPSSGRFLDGNRQSHESIGYTRDELLALTVPDIDPLVTAPVFHHHMQYLRSAAAPLLIESVHRRKDGTTFSVEVLAQLIRHEREYLVAVVRDSTARKQTEENLLRTQFAMDKAVDAVYWIDPQARILYANEAATSMLGYTADEFLRMTVHDLNPDFPSEVWPGWWSETKEKKVMSLETVHLTKDGRRIPIDIRVSFLAYGGQEFHCAYVRDISERKQVDEALRASQERFELAARATNDGIWDWNILTGEQYWSDRHLELFGLKPSTLIPTYERWIALVHPEDADRVHQATCRHLETREPYDIEMRVRMKDGRYRWFRDRGQAVWDSTGRPVRMVGSISDVTERRNAEGAIQKAHADLEQRVDERTSQLAMANQSLQNEIIERKRVEDRLQRTQYAVDHASDQIFVIGPDGFFLDVNESACSRLGYTKAELLTMSVMDIDPDFPPEKWSEFWAGFAQAGQLHLETRHCTKSGNIYPVEVVANYLCHEGQELDYAAVRDITERKRAEEAVHESELRYKLLTDATFDGIAIHDEGILLEVNAGLERMFGYGAGELIGQSIWDLIADESRDLVLTNINNGVLGPYEVIGRQKDGTTFPGEIVVRSYRYRGKDVRLVAGRDITERKHLELERTRHTEELERQVVERTVEIARLDSQRVQAERLAAMGRLAAGVAHEINNPIAGIKNAFMLVKQAVDPAHPHAEFAGMIDREIARVASIVQQMYQLYRPESGKGEPVELRLMMQDIKTLFAPRLQQCQLRLAIDVDSCLHGLLVPRGDVLQVLLNLLNNAIDCSDEGGTITLAVRVEPDAIRMAVSDQGPGIPPENLPHIFDPFFTTKTGGDLKGMGLGLSISQSLVLAMGGTIEVQTQPNSGSTFSVILPRRVAQAGAQDQLDTTNKEVMHHDE